MTHRGSCTHGGRWGSERAAEHKQPGGRSHGRYEQRARRTHPFDHTAVVERQQPDGLETPAYHDDEVVVRHGHSPGRARPRALAKR